jgi:hypothetical protein
MRTSLPRPIEPIETARNSNSNGMYIGEGTRNVYLNCYPYYISGTLPSPMSFSTAVANTPTSKLTTSPYDNKQQPQYSLSPSSLHEKYKRDHDLTDEEDKDGGGKFDSEFPSLLVKSSSISSSACRKKRVSILTSQTPTLSSSSSTLSSSSSPKGYHHAHHQSLYPVVASPTTEAVTTTCWEFNFTLPRLPSIKLKNVMHGLKRVASSSSTPRRHHHGGAHKDNSATLSQNTSLLSNEELSTVVAQCDDHDDHVEMLIAETVERETETNATTAAATAATPATNSTSTTILTSSKTIDVVYQRSRLLQHENLHENAVSCVSVTEEKNRHHRRISWKDDLCEYNDGSAWERDQEPRKKHQKQPQQLRQHHQQQPSTAESFISYYQFVAKDYSLRGNNHQQQSSLTTLPLTSPMNHARRQNVPLVSPRAHRRYHHHHHGRRAHQRRRRDPQWRAAQVERANEKWRMNVRGNV